MKSKVLNQINKKQPKLKNHPDKVGLDIYKLCQKLWPMTRSVTVDGLRKH